MATKKEGGIKRHPVECQDLSHRGDKKPNGFGQKTRMLSLFHQRGKKCYDARALLRRVTFIPWKVFLPAKSLLPRFMKPSPKIAYEHSLS